MVIKEYIVIGRRAPTLKEPKTKIYRMRLFAANTVVAKSRFWYFLSKLKKIKKSHGEILGVHEIREKNNQTIKNFGVFLRYRSHDADHNLYKEYRDVTRASAIQQMYSEMASRHNTKFQNIQIISIKSIPSSKVRRTSVKQFLNNKIMFPPTSICIRPSHRRLRSTYIAHRPHTVC